MIPISFQRKPLPFQSAQIAQLSLQFILNRKNIRLSGTGLMIMHNFDVSFMLSNSHMSIVIIGYGARQTKPDSLTVQDNPFVKKKCRLASHLC